MRVLALQAVWVLLLFVACASPFSVVEVSSPIGGASTDEAWDLSDESRRTLRIQNLADLWEVYPELAIRAIDRLASQEQGTALVAVLAELAFIEAQRLEVARSAAASGFYLLAAARAYEYLLSPAGAMERAFDPNFGHMAGIYRRASGAYLRDVLAESDGQLRDHVRHVLGKTYRVQAQRQSAARRPESFDEFLLADALTVKGFRYRHRQSGLGVPLVGVRENQGREAVESFYPPEGFFESVTAVLHFEVWEDEPTALLSLHDPLLHREIEIGGLKVPLAADFTAPYALLLERAELSKLSIQGVLDIEKAALRQGIFMIEPYDPDKIPVLMVHGLKSSAHIWAELTNDLNGDPALRRTYQIWHYLYPTGLPYLYSGQVLRDKLEEVRRVFDPTGKHAAMQSIVVIAHSMGGLLAKTLVSSSGHRLWDAIATVPPERFVGKPRHVRAFSRGFFFEPLPYIDRVIFISTPHRGSRVATALVGRLSAALVELPEAIRETYARVTEANWDFIRPEIRKLLASGGLSSIRALSPRHRSLQALADAPIDPSVKVHTIIGDRDTITGDPEVDSDGVVTHESAHIEGAASEITVPSKHDAYAHPLTILEIKRILKEHLAAR